MLISIAQSQHSGAAVVAEKQPRRAATTVVGGSLLPVALKRPRICEDAKPFESIEAGFSR